MRGNDDVYMHMKEVTLLNGGADVFAHCIMMAGVGAGGIEYREAAM